ncbi:MAG: patatin family protein [Clostridiales bacterium]|nr:patatin family protein [Clostridiales bacterium]
MRGSPKIGLALGAGASRGLAHIGVLQVLEEHGIIPDLMAGSSIGAIVGALYAAGITPKMMEGIAKNLDLKPYYDVGMPRLGFIKGERIEELIRLLTKGMTFDQLKIPLSITAVDLKSNQSVIINEGFVYKAVRASISIPGIFVPVFEGDQVLVDGGLLERLPNRVVREMGADIIIGVDVGFRGQHGDASNILGIILQSFDVMSLALVTNSINGDEIYIYPNLADVNPLLFDRAEESIEEGRRATLEMIGEIEERIRLFKTGSSQDPD